MSELRPASTSFRNFDLGDPPWPEEMVNQSFAVPPRQTVHEREARTREPSHSGRRSITLGSRRSQWVVPLPQASARVDLPEWFRRSATTPPNNATAYCPAGSWYARADRRVNRSESTESRRSRPASGGDATEGGRGGAVIPSVSLRDQGGGPMAMGDRRWSGTRRAVGAERGTPMRVLVAEDDPGLRSVLERGLRGARLRRRRRGRRGRSAGLPPLLPLRGGRPRLAHAEDAPASRS